MRIAVLIAVTAAAMGIATAPATAWASTTPVSYQATNEGSYDQLVIAFPSTPPAFSVSDSADAPIWGGSGKPVDMPGSYFIYLDGSGSVTAPTSNPATFDLPNLESVVLYDDFEGYVDFAVGLDHDASYTVTTSGDDVIIDVEH